MESEKINIYFEKVQRMLEQKKNSIHAEFDKAKRDFMQAYDPRINKTNTLLADVDNVRKSAENLKVKSDPLRFLQKVQECRQKICEVKEVPIPLVPNLAVPNLAVSPRMHKISLSKSPKRKANPWSQILHRVRTVSVVILLFSVVLAAASSGSFDMIVNEYVYAASSFLSHITGKAINSIPACWWQTAEEILHVTKRYSSNVMSFIENLAEFASRLTKDPEKRLLLGMELKKTTPVSTTVSPVVKINKKQVKTWSTCSVHFANSSDYGPVIPCKSWSLITTRPASHFLTLYEYLNPVRLYLSNAVGKAVSHISSYWKLIVEKVFFVKKKWQSYITTFIESGRNNLFL
ncbi:E3 ubiquitin- ligase TRIM13 [Pelobates cultripes]|uniref:E3 ubiquitin- ligase TRIM13 n=1 Tax=Pelobates cultripes TaxID=61616 RepID=A0AAD1THE4_PELCU|nr:E3 ubiquitin- ligase TRIM13 [Pelobates cultripes]